MLHGQVFDVANCMETSIQEKSKAKVNFLMYRDHFWPKYHVEHGEI